MASYTEDTWYIRLVLSWITRRYSGSSTHRSSMTPILRGDLLSNYVFFVDFYLVFSGFATLSHVFFPLRNMLREVGADFSMKLLSSNARSEKYFVHVAADHLHAVY